MTSSRTPTPAAEDAVAFQMMKATSGRCCRPWRTASATSSSCGFGLDGHQPRTLEQIGKQFGLSRERVRQIERETMAQAA